LLGPGAPALGGNAACALTGEYQHLFSFTPEGAHVSHSLALRPEGGELLWFDDDGCSSGDLAWTPGGVWNTTYKYMADDGGSPILFHENLVNGQPEDPSSRTCGPNSASGPPEFWLGPGELTIGTFGELGFDGVLDGILVDPNDSVPPSYNPSE
jgi:hypothetical protein